MVCSGSIQCQADEMVAASRHPDRRGRCSAQLRTARTRGERSASTSSIRWSGSTATTASALDSSWRVSAPVPAPRSATVPAGDRRTHSTAAIGGPGRKRS